MADLVPTVSKPRKKKLKNLPIALVCAATSSASALSGKVLSNRGVGVLVQWIGLILGAAMGAAITVYRDPTVLPKLRDLLSGELMIMDYTTQAWLWITCIGADLMWICILAAQVFLNSACAVALSYALGLVFIALLSLVFIEDYYQTQVRNKTIYYSMSSIMMCIIGASIMMSFGTEASSLANSIGFIICGSLSNALRNVGIEYLTSKNPIVFDPQIMLGARFILGGIMGSIKFCIAVSLIALFFNDSVSLSKQLNFTHLFESWLSLLVWLFGLSLMFALGSILATLSVLRTNALWTNVIITSLIPITLLSEMVILGSKENTSNIIGMVCIMLGSLVIPLIPLIGPMMDEFSEYVSFIETDDSTDNKYNIDNKNNDDNPSVMAEDEMTELIGTNV